LQGGSVPGPAAPKRNQLDDRVTVLVRELAAAKAA